MVVVAGCDEVDVLVADSCDGEDTTNNGLLIDCAGTGFCIAGVVVVSKLSLIDITYSNQLSPCQLINYIVSYTITKLFYLDGSKL